MNALNRLKPLTERRLVTYVLEQDVERLQELHADVPARLLPQDVEEKCKHVLLQKETGKKDRVRSHESSHKKKRGGGTYSKTELSF